MELQVERETDRAIKEREQLTRKIKNNKFQAKTKKPTVTAIKQHKHTSTDRDTHIHR